MSCSRKKEWEFLKISICVLSIPEISFLITSNSDSDVESNVFTVDSKANNSCIYNTHSKYTCPIFQGLPLLCLKVMFIVIDVKKNAKIALL